MHVNLLFEHKTKIWRGTSMSTLKGEIFVYFKILIIWFLSYFGYYESK